MVERLEQAWSEHVATAPAADTFERSLMSEVEVFTWEQMQAVLIGAVEKEKALVTTLFGVISVVAVFLVLCIFYMIVQEKVRDIGIIKSIGGSAAGVAGIFLGYGAAIGALGSMLGAVLGAVFVKYINEIQDWLASIHPSLRVWSKEVYVFDRIPNEVKGADVAVIMVVAVIAAILGAVIPAWRAARTWPAEALRYE
jgi:lipoprotein-releasing system permease protein